MKRSCAASPSGLGLALGWVWGLLAFVAAAALPSQATANPWTRNQWGHYVNLSYSVMTSKKIYGPDFKIQSLTSRYTQHELAAYAELGLIDRWLTLVANGTLVRNTRLSDQGATTGLGDFRFGLWSGLLVSPFRLAAGVTVGVPTGDDTPSATGGTAQNELVARSLPTGDGETDVAFDLEAGHGFAWNGWPLQHYGIVQAGYWLRTKGFADAFNWKLEWGSKWPGGWTERLWFVVKFFGSESFASNREAAASASGLGNGVTHRSVGVQILADVWQGLGFLVGVDGAFARARNIAAAARIHVGISYEGLPPVAGGGES